MPGVSPERRITNPGVIFLYGWTEQFSTITGIIDNQLLFNPAAPLRRRTWSFLIMIF